MDEVLGEKGAQLGVDAACARKRIPGDACMHLGVQSASMCEVLGEEGAQMRAPPCLSALVLAKCPGCISACQMSRKCLGYWVRPGARHRSVHAFDGIHMSSSRMDGTHMSSSRMDGTHMSSSCFVL